VIERKDPLIVLNQCSADRQLYALHGQDEGVLQTRGILTARVQLHKLCSRLARVHDLLGQVWAQRNMVIWVTDPLQCVGLADIHGGDVSV
jgi:hypothetical protein